MHLADLVKEIGGRLCHAKNSVLVVHSGLRLSAKDILKHEWFNKDGVTVTQARQVMGLRPDMTEERDSGKGNT